MSFCNSRENAVQLDPPSSKRAATFTVCSSEREAEGSDSPLLCETHDNNCCIYGGHNFTGYSWIMQLHTHEEHYHGAAAHDLSTNSDKARPGPAHHRPTSPVWRIVQIMTYTLTDSEASRTVQTSSDPSTSHTQGVTGPNLLILRVDSPRLGMDSGLPTSSHPVTPEASADDGPSLPEPELEPEGDTMVSLDLSGPRDPSLVDQPQPLVDHLPSEPTGLRRSTRSRRMTSRMQESLSQQPSQKRRCIRSSGTAACASPRWASGADQPTASTADEPVTDSELTDSEQQTLMQEDRLIETEEDTMGLFRHYTVLPSTDPDQHLTIHHVSDAPTFNDDWKEAVIKVPLPLVRTRYKNEDDAPMLEIPASVDDLYMALFDQAVPPASLKHFKRDIMQGIWSSLLNCPDFIDAYTNGLVILCGNGRWRRLFPQFSAYSADYVERLSNRVLIACIKSNGKHLCATCQTSHDQVLRLGTKLHDQIWASRR
ncbi:hypothetical protein F5888DRAFT_1636512 [Russula emetica]|nr:hypothetical protein F5888DRAFT_1636512 [Russula emetica]